MGGYRPVDWYRCGPEKPTGDQGFVFAGEDLATVI